MHPHSEEGTNQKPPAPANKATFNHVCHPHTTTLVMGKKDLDTLMALHEMVTASPDFMDPETGESFVRPRSRESIERHIAGGHHVIAVYSEAPEFKGMMIAHALLALPDLDGASNLEGYPIKDAAKTAIVQAFTVHPEHKRCGIEALFEAIEIMAAAEGRTRILAKMNAKNEPSIRMFGNTVNPRARYVQVGKPVKVPGQKYTSVFMEKRLDAPAANLGTIQQPKTRNALVHS